MKKSMSSVLNLVVDPAQVSEELWRSIYADSLKVLEAFPEGVIGEGVRHIEETAVRCFGRQFVFGGGFAVGSEPVASLESASADVTETDVVDASDVPRCCVDAGFHGTEEFHGTEKHPGGTHPGRVEARRFPLTGQVRQNRSGTTPSGCFDSGRYASVGPRSVRAEISGNCWRIVGDAQSRQTADAFSLPESVHEIPPVGGHFVWGITSPQSPGTRLMARAARGDLPGNVFSGATRHLPYHQVACAVAILIENRLPGAALVYGDIDAEDAAEACALLETALGESFQMPVLLTPSRAEALLANVLGEVETARILRRYARAPRKHVELLLRSLRTIPERYFEKELIDCVSSRVGSLSALSQWFVGALINEIVLMHQNEPQPLRDQLTPKDSRRLVAFFTKKLPLQLTEWAWNDLELAGPVKLEFLVDVASAQPKSSHGWTLLWAIFESNVVRRYAFEAWRTACAEGASAYPEEVPAHLVLDLNEERDRVSGEIEQCAHGGSERATS